MRWMLSVIVIATLGLVYWVSSRIYWWRKAFETPWTVTSEGASESLYAAGVLGLNDLTVSGDAVGKGTLPSGPGLTSTGSTTADQQGQGGTGSTTITTEEPGDCDVDLSRLQLLIEQGIEIRQGERSETLAAWCRCQDRTYWEYFTWCDPFMVGYNG